MRLYFINCWLTSAKFWRLKFREIQKIFVGWEFIFEVSQRRSFVKVSILILVVLALNFKEFFELTGFRAY